MRKGPVQMVNVVAWLLFVQSSFSEDKETGRRQTWLWVENPNLIGWLEIMNASTVCAACDVHCEKLRHALIPPGSGVGSVL